MLCSARQDRAWPPSLAASKRRGLKPGLGGSTAASFVTAACALFDVFAARACRGTTLTKITEAITTAVLPIHVISDIMAERERQLAKLSSASEASFVSPSLVVEDRVARTAHSGRQNPTVEPATTR